MATVVNGQMGSGVLVSVGGGQALRADAAAAWLAVVAEVRARFGITLRLTDSYRPYSVQVRIFNERYDPASSGGGPFGDVRWWGGVRYVRRRGASAAVPGTSNHGLGVAVDVTGLGGFDTSDGSAYARLAAVAPAHGWSNKAGRKINEPWHWEYSPADDTKAKTPAPAQEDDMPFTPEELRGEVKTAISEMLLEVATGDAAYGRQTADNLTAASRVTAHRILTAMATRSDATGRQMADMLRTIVVAPTPAAVIQAIPDEFVQAVLDGLYARLHA